jgi:hypothetical protein
LKCFAAALASGVLGLAAGTLLSVVVLWFAGRAANSLYLIAILLTSFPSLGFAFGFELVWLRMKRE